ncbi:hypothetical protein IMCC3317_21190 [Kordia antarctica]|uniref:DUF2975 domain-containing protein n=1 Tax=Kordia antarctica TaxID=1218801 RepID=A0A7L4ZJZ8_9FLAO|nr:hypothetical protein [Kordia antarctica]QHI36749.1 hypothetical protein IMCC3317_21190 [Kordia antarctica]
MRAFKIILIIILILVLFILALGTIEIYKENRPEAFAICIFTSIGIVFGLLTIVYHIKSFRYYRKSKRLEKAKKISIILWISAVASSIYTLFFGAVALLGISANTAELSSNPEYLSMIIMLIIILLYGISSLVEVSLLKKRIKTQREEVLLHTEIDEIGL